MSTKRERGAAADEAQNAPQGKRKRVGPVFESLKLPTKKVEEEVLLCRAEMINVQTRSDAVTLRQLHLVDELGAIQAEFAAFKHEVRNQIGELDNTIKLLTAVLSHRQQQGNTTREDAQADEREAMED